MGFGRLGEVCAPYGGNIVTLKSSKTWKLKLFGAIKSSKVSLEKEMSKQEAQIFSKVIVSTSMINSSSTTDAAAMLKLCIERCGIFWLDLKVWSFFRSYFQ